MTWALHSALILIPDKMCLRYLGFVLLVWFPGALHAQSAAQPCHAPRLNHGYFVPDQPMYAHESTLTYACDNTYKPVAEYWWAKITCQNGTWSHKPQCIDEKACFPPTIPNANYSNNQDGWFEDGHKIRIKCHRGYEPKNRNATAVCTNGSWSPVLDCEKSTLACGEPPQVPHAVIIRQGYQEVFSVDSEVQYECKDGYTVDGTEKKSIICMSGNWTGGPTCSRGIGAGTRSTVEGTSGRHTNRENRPSTGGTSHSGTPSTGGGRGIEAGTRSTVEGTSGRHTNKENRPSTGGTSHSGTPSTGGVDHCGEYPVVPNSVAVKENEFSLKYQCNNYYKLVGPETVMCHSDGRWSELPFCKDAFCVLNPGQFVRGYVVMQPGAEYIQEGATKQFNCIWSYITSVARCINGRITLTRCCRYYEHHEGACTAFTAAELIH